MYKCGDKLVIKIDETDALDLNNGQTVIVYNKQFLGKLKDFMPSEEKIKMTAEEKKEFDRLYPDTWKDVLDFLDEIHDWSDNYPNLNKRLFAGDITNIFHSQIEFVKALEKPSLIEVEKEKKYYVHLFKSQEYGYLNQDRDSLELIISNIDEAHMYKTKFTKSEIAKMHFSNFKLNDDALEEVEDE